jgi:hypothetical protein
LFKDHAHFAKILSLWLLVRLFDEYQSVCIVERDQLFELASFTTDSGERIAPPAQNRSMQSPTPMKRLFVQIGGGSRSLW